MGSVAFFDGSSLIYQLILAIALLSALHNSLTPLAGDP